MRKTANYVREEAIKIIDEKIEDMRKLYDKDMDYIRSCVPESMRGFTTGMVMMEARSIACRKDEYDLRRRIQRRDELAERADILYKIRNQIKNI